MPRQIDWEKFNDFLILQTTGLKTPKLAQILELSTSALSRWKNMPAYKKKKKQVEMRAEKSDEDVLDTKVLDTKVKYAIKSMFKDASLSEIKGLCRAFKDNDPNKLSQPYYTRLADNAKLVDLDTRQLFDALAKRAKNIIMEHENVG